MQLNTTTQRPRNIMRRVLGSLLLAVFSASIGCEEPWTASEPISTNSDAGAATTEARGPEEAPPPVPKKQPREQTLRLAIISAKPAAAVAKYSQLAQQLAVSTDRAVGVVDASSSADTSIARLCSGESDLLLDTVVASVRTMVACGAQPLLVAAKKNTLRYASIVFVRRGSPLQSLADLANHTIAFEDAMSTSSYLLPRFLIEDSGLKLIAAGQAQRPGAVSYSFVSDELNIVGRVVHGLADAGALSTNDMEEYREAAVRIIGRSPEVPRQLLMGSATLSEEAVGSMRARALRLHEGESGKRALALARIGRFDSVTKADRQVLEWLRKRERELPK